jgi:O-antigen biosynthesis protein
MTMMSSLRRAWTAFRSRPRAERVQILKRALARLRADGVAATLAWARAGGAVSRQADRYDDWVRRHTPDDAALAEMRAAANRLPFRPVISVLTAAYNTPPALLDAAADSVIAQAYDRWEWHIADDGSSDCRTRAALERLSARDPRIRLHRLDRNSGISAASNLALRAARGEYVALLDHDDALVPHALFSVVRSLNGTTPPPDVVYSDEDKLDLDGRRCDAYFKPDWSPDLFRSSMYACHLLVVRRELVAEVGGFCGEFDFSQDYDLLLRVIERTERIAHVDDVLYHWRKTLASTALAGEAKPTAHAAGARALQAHLDRQHIGGRIVAAGSPGLYRVKYEIAGHPLVSVVLPTRDPASCEFAHWLAALATATAYRPFEVIVVSPTGAVPLEAPAGIAVRGVAAVGPFNVSASINAGARVTTGQHLLVVHDDVEPRHPEWLEAMLELSLQPWVGAVGAKLFGRDGTLQHAGLILGLRGIAGAPFRGFSPETAGYYSAANCIRNYSAVSGACLMTRRDVFERVGGFDEALPGEGADVDYGLRVCNAGLRVVFTPYARLRHTERGGVSGRRATPAEVAHLRQRWGGRLDADPFYNRNLTKDEIDYRVQP